MTKAKVAKAKAKAELIRRALMHAFHLSVTAVEMAVPFATCPQPLPSYIIQQACSTSNLQRNLILVATAEQHHPEGMRISVGDAGAAAMQSQSPTSIGTEASQMHPALEEARSQYWHRPEPRTDRGST